MDNNSVLDTFLYACKKLKELNNSRGNIFVSYSKDFENFRLDLADQPICRFGEKNFLQKGKKTQKLIRLKYFEFFNFIVGAKGYHQWTPTSSKDLWESFGPFIRGEQQHWPCKMC